MRLVGTASLQPQEKTLSFYSHEDIPGNAVVLSSNPGMFAVVFTLVRTFPVVAPTTETVTGLTMTADALENLTLIYTTASGQTRLDFDKNLNRR